jgi:hypothetical protein
MVGGTNVLCRSAAIVGLPLALPLSRCPANELARLAIDVKHVVFQFERKGAIRQPSDLQLFIRCYGYYRRAALQSQTRGGEHVRHLVGYRGLSLSWRRRETATCMSASLVSWTRIATSGRSLHGCSARLIAKCPRCCWRSMLCLCWLRQAWRFMAGGYGIGRFGTSLGSM